MTKCTYDPKEMAGQPIGMFHCPECGDMVLAGMDHPPPFDDEITKKYFEEKEQLLKVYLYKHMAKEDVDKFWELMEKTPNFFACMMEIWFRAEHTFREQGAF